MNWTPYQHIPVYRPPTNHLLTINHLPTDHLHVSTIYRPLTDHLPTINRLTTDHLPGNAACNLHLVVCRWRFSDMWGCGQTHKCELGRGQMHLIYFGVFIPAWLQTLTLSIKFFLSDVLSSCIFLQVIDRVNVPEDLENLWEQPWCCESTRQKVIMTALRIKHRTQGT